MKISENAINALKDLEGTVKKDGLHVIYDDSTGQFVPVENGRRVSGATIGYGHLILPDESFEGGLTEAQATNLLLADIKKTEEVINKALTVHLNQNQYDALVILVYNIGEKNFLRSTVLKYINNPNFFSKSYPNLKSAWLAWNKYRGRVSKGLTYRRNYEWRLFYNGIYD